MLDICRHHSRHLQILLLLFLTSKQMLTDQVGNTVRLSQYGVYAFQFPPNDTLGHLLRSPLPEDLVSYMPLVAVLSGFARLLGGYMALKKNNKYLLLGISLANTTILGLVPLLTNLWGLVAKVVLESTTIILRGFSEAIVYNIVAHWLPQSEMAVCVGLLFSAEPIAFLFAFSPTHWIGSKYGASSLFYYVVFFHAAWSLVYFIFGAQDPRTCYFLSAEEREYIFREIGEKRRIGSEVPLPWKEMLKTPIYYGIFASELAYKWSYTLTNTSMDNLVGNTTEWTRNIFALGLVLMPVIVLVIFKILDMGTRLNLINNNDARKIANTIGLWGTGLFALLIGYCTDTSVVYSVYVAYRLTVAFIFVGYKVTIYNISPNYAALVAAFVTGVSIITMSSKQYLIEIMVADKRDHKSYKMLLYIVALMSYIANIIFIISGHIFVRNFDSIGSVDWRKDSILTYP